MFMEYQVYMVDKYLSVCFQFYKHVFKIYIFCFFYNIKV